MLLPILAAAALTNPESTNSYPDSPLCCIEKFEEACDCRVYEDTDMRSEVVRTRSYI